MDDLKQLVNFTGNCLENGKPCILALKISGEKSTSSADRARMVMAADGQNCGASGESQWQAAALIEAPNIFIEKRSRFLKFNPEGENISSGERPEAGQTRLFLDYIPATQANLGFFRAWEAVIRGGKDHYCMTIDPGLNPALSISGHTLLFKDKSALDGYAWPPEVMGGILPELHTVDSIMVLEVKNRQIVIDPVRHIKSLYIFGAGPVSIPTARIAAMSGFRVVVMDNEAEQANIAHFPDAQEVHVIDDFKTVMQGLKIDQDSFIAIITRGHQHDSEVLEQALKTRAGYIGMVCGRGKRDSIYTNLLAEGLKQEQLARVHCPIGLTIGGETPAEIAVSIVAELISIRSGLTAQR